MATKTSKSLQALDTKLTLYKVVVIQEGYSFLDEKQKNRASGTVSLVYGPRQKILVDTGSPWDGAKILDKLKQFGVEADKIDTVVCTHGHIDHVGNLNHFQRAKQIVSHDIACEPDIYENHQFKDDNPYDIDRDCVKVVATPGHTHSDISVVVKTEDLGTVVICGDLFECENDEQTWRDVSDAPEIQEESRRKVLAIADYIIPGHGSMFKVIRGNH